MRRREGGRQRLTSDRTSTHLRTDSDDEVKAALDVRGLQAEGEGGNTVGWEYGWRGRRMAGGGKKSILRIAMQCSAVQWMRTLAWREKESLLLKACIF